MFDALATAVTTSLNAGSWTPTFTAVKSTRPTWTLEDLATLRCTVAARTLVQASDGRKHIRRTCDVEINFQQHCDLAVGQTREQWIEARNALLEELLAWFKPGYRPSTSPDDCVIVGAMAGNTPLVAADLDERECFNGSVVLTFVRESSTA